MDAGLPKSLIAVNRVFTFLNRVGVPTGSINLLTVTGRKSGQPRSTPVTPARLDGHDYLVAGVPTSEWVKNARAAGTATLSRGRRSTRVTLVEVTDDALKARVAVAYAHINPQTGRFLTEVGAATEKTDAGYAAAAPNIAVFEVTRH